MGDNVCRRLGDYTRHQGGKGGAEPTRVGAEEEEEEEEKRKMLKEEKEENRIGGGEGRGKE